MRIGKLFIAMSFLLLACVSCATVSPSMKERAGEITIAENGRAMADIVIPEEPPYVLKFAAEELKMYLDKITGGDFQITSEPTAPVKIRLGQSAESDAAGLNISVLKRDGFYISAQGGDIYILGQDSPADSFSSKYYLFYHEPKRATLLGVYEFLERLGVRWPAPGPDNEVVPSKADIRIPIGTQKIEPFFPDRELSLYSRSVWNNYPDKSDYGEHVDNMSIWGLRLKGSSFYMVSGGHTEENLRLKDAWLPEHPERFALIDGKRDTRYSCWTDPGVIDMWKQLADAHFSGKSPAEAGLTIDEWPYTFKVYNPDEFMVDPMDHDEITDGRCRCDRCNAFREKYPCDSDTELLWHAIAEVAEYIKVKHPGKFITTAVYPPKWSFPETVEIPDNVRVRICVLGATQIPLPQTTKCDLELIKRWKDALGDKPLLQTYQTIGRFVPGIPEIYPHLFAEFLSLVRDDIDGMFFEQISPTHTHGNLNTYIAARFLWDPDRDIDKELSEYFTLYYGPGAKPAQELFKRFEDNWIKHWKETTPDMLWDKGRHLLLPIKERQEHIWTQVYTAEEMAKIEALVTEVEEATASEPVYSKRAGLLRKWILENMKTERAQAL